MVARSISEGTKGRIVDAALQTLKEKGFTATSARAIAASGGFNQALVFYHFGSVNDLLLAALDRTSEQRMVRYKAAVDAVHTLPDLLRVASEMYREDLDGDHVAVLAELIAGSSSAPEPGSPKRRWPGWWPNPRCRRTCAAAMSPSASSPSTWALPSWSGWATSARAPSRCSRPASAWPRCSET
jgi:AcrR family transcriptional regulator